MNNIEEEEKYPCKVNRRIKREKQESADAKPHDTNGIGLAQGIGTMKLLAEKRVHTHS